MTPWLPAMQEHHELHNLDGPMSQTMRMVWIGRDHTELKAMRPYLPPANTVVFLTRETEISEVMIECSDSAAEAAAMPSGQNTIGHSQAKPWLFAFVGVVSLVLTQMSYYYLRGEHSVYYVYETGCGEGCFEGQPTQAQYLLSKVLPVACSLVAIAITAVFARRGRRHMSLWKCPCAAAVHAQCSPHAQRTQQMPQGLAPSTLPKCGRPDMLALINQLLTEIDASTTLASGTTTGLCVCVCGPDSLIQSCKDAVKCTRNQHHQKNVAISLHIEEPGW